MDVEALRLPRPVTVDQVTPAWLGSLATVAVINCVVPWSIDFGLLGDNVTEIAAVIVIEREPVVAVKPRESVTFTVNVNVLATVGGPALINPVEAPKLSDVGREPEATEKL